MTPLSAKPLVPSRGLRQKSDQARADIVSVPPQPRHASLNGGEPRSSSGSLAMLAAMRRASSRVSFAV